MKIIIRVEIERKSNTCSAIGDKIFIGKYLSLHGSRFQSPNRKSLTVK